MSLFRKALPGLYDGVSQQSATMRTALQCEEQVNAWATIADGLSKRPPSEHLAKVSNTPIGSASIHHINRDTTERYIVVVTDGDLKVYDHLTGVAKTVDFPKGKNYLNCNNAVTDFGLVTVADYTFVVNRTVTCAMEASGSTYDYGDNRWLNRTYVEGEFETTYPGSVFQYPFATEAGESYMGEKQTFEDLPDTASIGQIYKITGSGDNNFNAFYVKRVGGVWEEYRQPGLNNRIDFNTMPHALVREGDGTFTFAPFSWAERSVGDERSNPAPTFIGRSIRDLFFVQNRLGLLIGENTVLSCASDFGNFWRNTVTAYVASDTIDVAVTGSQVSELYHAVPFADTVMLFSDQNQFVLSWSADGLTPDSVTLTPTTAYRTNVTAKPVAIGRDVYFCANSSGYSRVYEYFSRSASEGALTEAADITAHVPRYVPRDITKLAADATNEAIFVLSSAAPNRLYTYKFTWGEGQQKAQSNWGYWEFDSSTTLLSAVCLDSYVYLLAQRADGVYLERINLEFRVEAAGLDNPVYLDRLCQVTGNYNSVLNRTIFILPYQFPTSAVRAVRGATFATKEALFDPSQYTFPAASQVSIPGDHSGKPVWFGLAYTLRYTFSPQFATTDSGAILTGRTILRSMTVRFTDSAYFKTEVAPYGDNPTVESVVPAKLAEFTGKTLGEDSFILGQPTYGTGDYTFQVYGEADVAKITLTNDTHVASTFQSAEVEITYHNRSR